MSPLRSIFATDDAAAVGLVAVSVDESTMSSDVCALSQMRPGQTGEVLEITAQPALALHILEIGLVRGATIRFLRAAPLGGPIEIEVEGFLLSLRRNEADTIIVGIDHNGASPRGA